MRTIIYSRVAAVVMLAALGTAARAETEQTFEHDGYTYRYTTARQDDGGTVIHGRRFPDRQPFHLVVAKGRVVGRSGDLPVSFRVADAKGAAAGVVATQIVASR